MKQSGTNMVEFRLLGPVEVWAGNRLVDTGQPRQRSVLAALLVDAGRLVTLETLIDRVWGEAPPPGARATLYTHIAWIRRVLAKTAESDQPLIRLERRPGGYVLAAHPDQVDLHRARRLATRARADDCSVADRVLLLRQAVALWRGEPLAGLRGPWAARVRDRCLQQRLDLVIAWADAELHSGDPTPVIEQLTDLIGDYSLDEPLAAVLIRALHAAGHTAAALDRYTITRQRLADELGTEPGPDLQHLYTAILRSQNDVVSARRSQTTRAVPRQLPAPVSHFVGRTAELTELSRRLDETVAIGTMMMVIAIAGAAGIGKTALAVHWAHRVANQFPDGQLYVNLRGFDPSGAPVPAATAIRGFLDALQVPPDRIPGDLDAQIGLYRSLLAERRMLIVLDNARDTDQVRQLLPGSPGCLVLVTSRNLLTDLIATEAAHPVMLDLLTGAEGRDLLVRRLGAERVHAEPEAVDDIVTRCARLPLALAIAAARAAILPDLPLAALAGEMRDADSRLDAFDIGETLANVRTVFSWSYRCLSAPAARLFRMFGLHPGPDISAPAAATLGGLSRMEVRPLLAELISASLIVERSPGRYTAHDLLRAYATEQAQRIDSEEQQHSTTHRILEHYLRASRACAVQVHPHRQPPELADPLPGVTPDLPGNHGEAMAWFAAERTVVVAAIGRAYATGFDTHAWQLAWAISDYLDMRGYWHDAAAIERTALAAAHRLGDRSALTRTHRRLARAYVQLDRGDDAEAHIRHALDLAAATDHAARARIHLELAKVYEGRGRHRDALAEAQQALVQFRVAGPRVGEAYSLNAVGWLNIQLGDHRLGIASCRRALAVLQEIGDRPGQAATWDSLGYAHHQLGHHREAVACYRQAVDLSRNFGADYHEADALHHLGTALLAAGDTEAAATAWRSALAILDRLGHTDADQVRTRLEAVDPG